MTKRPDPAMRGFIIHLCIFVVVVGGLAALNLYRHPDHIWFIWVLAGWGIGLAATTWRFCCSALGGGRRS